MHNGTVLVFGDGGLVAFRSISAAEQYLEPIDVQNDEYTAFDPTGGRLDLFVETSRSQGLAGAMGGVHERVRLKTSQAARAPEELRVRLLNALLLAEPRRTLQERNQLSLSALIEKAISVYGYS